MEEQFNRLGDYTLRVDFRRQEEVRDGVQKCDGYTKLFNFLSRQVTTIHRDWLSEGRGSGAAGNSAVSTSTIIESFDALPSDAEVKYMHAKLIALEGKPPALDDVLPKGPGKLPSALRPATQG